MAAKKYYAVRKGKTRGIFASWEECKACVEGFSGAEYKGFACLEDAVDYVGKEACGQFLESLAKAEDCQTLAAEDISGRKTVKKKTSAKQDSAQNKDELPPPGTLLAYVDGSYNHSLKKYAFGCVFILPDGRIYVEFGNGDREQSLQQRNVAGEMLGAMYAVKTAMLNGYEKVKLCYDYEGIEKWVTGAWRSKTELTAAYAEAMRQWRKKIEISFMKVAAHTNVYYNELADQTAKRGLKEAQGVPKVRKLEEMECIIDESIMREGACGVNESGVNESVIKNQS